MISCIPCGSEAQPEGGGGLNVCVTGVAGPDLVQSPVLGLCSAPRADGLCSAPREVLVDMRLSVAGSV